MNTSAVCDLCERNSCQVALSITVTRAQEGIHRLRRSSPVQNCRITYYKVGIAHRIREHSVVL